MKLWEQPLMEFLQGGKTARRERALKRLSVSIKALEPALKLAENSTFGKEGNLKTVSSDVRKQLDRMKREANTLSDILSGKKKEKVDDKGKTVIEAPKDKWFIDTYAIHLGYVKNSDRRKNKGKSRKKMRKTRSTTFVKSVVMQPGMMQAYREGRMGISPRQHSFRARKEEPNYFN